MESCGKPESSAPRASHRPALKLNGKRYKEASDGAESRTQPVRRRVRTMMLPGKLADGPQTAALIRYMMKTLTC